MIEEKKWNSLQKNIFDDVKYGTGNTEIRAVAGAGKTSCLIESLKYVPEGASWLLLAFSKKIASELVKRAPAGGEVGTLHKLGTKSIGRTFKEMSIDTDKMSNLLDKTYPEFKWLFPERKAILKTVSLAKAYLAHNCVALEDLLDKYPIDIPDFENDKIIEITLRLMQLARESTDIIDFDDMIYFPNVLKIVVPKFDYIFVDEVQDLNYGQWQFILKMRKKKTRTFIFGDPHQAIFEFSGTAIDSMEKFREALSAKTLPMSISYRCPKLVVNELQKLVPEIQSAPLAINGSVNSISLIEMETLAKPGCFIISRTNKELVPLALKFLKNKMPCNIQGRDLGEDLLGIISRSKCNNINDFIVYLDQWLIKQKEKLRLRKKTSDILTDKVQCLHLLTLDCESISELQSLINKLFSDLNDTKKIILGTAHGLKGNQRHIVFVLNWTFNNTNQEERNLQYVAKSRAAQALYLVKLN